MFLKLLVIVLSIFVISSGKMRQCQMRSLKSFLNPSLDVINANAFSGQTGGSLEDGHDNRVRRAADGQLGAESQLRSIIRDILRSKRGTVGGGSAPDWTSFFNHQSGSSGSKSPLAGSSDFSGAPSQFQFPGGSNCMKSAAKLMDMWKEMNGLVMSCAKEMPQYFKSLSGWPQSNPKIPDSPKGLDK